MIKITDALVASPTVLGVDSHFAVADGAEGAALVVAGQVLVRHQNVLAVRNLAEHHEDHHCDGPQQEQQLENQIRVRGCNHQNQQEAEGQRKLAHHAHLFAIHGKLKTIFSSRFFF